MTLQLGHKKWLSSQELTSVYGRDISYANAARAARRMVDDYNLPWYRVGNKWYTTSPEVSEALAPAIESTLREAS